MQQPSWIVTGPFFVLTSMLVWGGWAFINEFTLCKSPSLSLMLSVARVRHCVFLSISRIVEHLDPPTACAEAGAATSRIKLAAPNASVANLVEVFIEISFLSLRLSAFT